MRCACKVLHSSIEPVTTPVALSFPHHYDAHWVLFDIVFDSNLSREQVKQLSASFSFHSTFLKRRRPESIPNVTPATRARLKWKPHVFF